MNLELAFGKLMLYKHEHYIVSNFIKNNQSKIYRYPTYQF